MDYARMESSGPWFPANLRAAAILGYRAVTTGEMSFSDLQGQLALRFPNELRGKSPPSDEIIRRWHKNEPEYPERVVRDGLVERSHLPMWGQRHLRQEPPSAAMHQADPSHRRAQSEGIGWGWLVLVGLLWALTRNSGSRSASQQTPAPGLLDLYKGRF